ncbi:DUF2997 domain-containing protein [Mycetocola zhadangensis]|uniref:DUF2997 domain-containing protein n=1 Tax=Mycetocola zhadangensis TaxID=1164595 RepID=A0A3L7J176_9MICO|nr:DUF2997 domain-containing protein [Mycetocola zhadangensis]RLQ84253.1 DUF2997 domain-containing protein [Mycetocola zhadangensis]GGE94703.1 hypothetical protein GCM10011313_17100 [Mycetocola zhadangensis]
MTDKQLIVQVRPDGTVHAETIGMYGEECLDYIAVLENLLDAEATESSFTEAYAQVAAEQHTTTSTWDGVR